MTDHNEEIQRRATLGGGEGDLAGSADQIRDYVRSELEGFAGVHDDESTLPVSAESRGLSGTFFDASDVFKYLENGNLLITDNNDNPVVNPIVHLVIRYDPYWESDIIEVWIDDDT